MKRIVSVTKDKIEITEINLDYIKNNESSFDPYRIGIGDGLSITVWGLLKFSDGKFGPRSIAQKS